MKVKSLLSVILVTYNAGKHISLCLETINRLAAGKIQLIIIDGGSKDDTLQIIEKYKAIVDTLVSEPDQGIYDAMNKGIKYVKGKWVYFLGADDLLADGFLNMLNELKQPETIYYGMVKVNSQLYKDVYSSYRLSKLNICHQAICYPIGVIKKYPYQTHYPICADWFLNLQAWQDPSYKFVYKAHLMCTFGIEGISSTAIDHQFEKDRSQLVLKYLGLFVWLRFRFRAAKIKLLRKNSKSV